MSEYVAPKRAPSRVERALLDALVPLRQPENREDWAGICYNVGRNMVDRDCVNTVNHSMFRLMQKWPGKAPAASRGYPVEGDGKAYGYAAARDSLWTNPRRLELLEWLITEVTEGRLYDQDSEG